MPRERSPRSGGTEAHREPGPSSPSQRLARRRPSLIALALAALVGALSLGFLQAEISALPLTRTAEALEAARALPRIAPTSRAVLEAAAPAGPGCAERPLRARLSAALFLLERDVADGVDLDMRLQRFEAADAAARASLACAPLDGQTWARLASLEFLAAFEPVRYGAMMRLSARQTPYEGAAMALRWVSLAQSPDLAEQLADPLLRVDLCRFLAGGAPDDSLALLTALDRPETRAGLVGVLSAVPLDRREPLLTRAAKLEQAQAAELLARAAEAPPLPVEACGFDARHPLPPSPRKPVRFLQTAG
ncbi:hypothetical protein [Aureimonas sp. AU40]|uniref:hypothetical protein n=1 Tax=Aureimonas sp. AU40 TaxID=1637747 RepID=UPI0007859FE5|nr:hypothetical protein [Aureimonas sp. AU40]